jgi:hypothetical protein
MTTHNRFHTPNRWLALSLALLASLLVNSGCAPWSTYPPTPDTRGFTNGHLQPIPDIMVEALTYAREKHGNGGEMVINLPFVAEPSIYTRIAKRLGGDVRPMTVEGEPAYTIQQVRSRGDNAQVDLIYPVPGGLESATYTLRHDFIGGYYVDYARIWRVPVKTPPSNYLAHLAEFGDKTIVAVPDQPEN